MRENSKFDSLTTEFGGYEDMERVTFGIQNRQSCVRPSTWDRIHLLVELNYKI